MKRFFRILGITFVLSFFPSLIIGRIEVLRLYQPYLGIGIGTVLLCIFLIMEKRRHSLNSK